MHVYNVTHILREIREENKKSHSMGYHDPIIYILAILRSVARYFSSV